MNLVFVKLLKIVYVSSGSNTNFTTSTEISNKDEIFNWCGERGYKDLDTTLLDTILYLLATTFVKYLQYYSSSRKRHFSI